MMKKITDGGVPGSGFMDGEDRGWLQVIMTLLFLFTKQVTEAWKAWPFYIFLFFIPLYWESQVLQFCFTVFMQ